MVSKTISPGSNPGTPASLSEACPPPCMIIKEKTSFNIFGSFVKVAVDIEQRVLAAGCELHIDCMEELLKERSLPKDIWGANVYPEDKTIDFVSLINIRPAQGNRSMEIEDPVLKKRVEDVIRSLMSNGT